MADSMQPRPDIDAWLITLVTHGLIVAAWRTRDGGWLVQRGPAPDREHLRHAEEALAFIAERQRESRRSSLVRTAA